MTTINKLNRYLYDNEYRIIIKENYVNIINYEEIVDFNSNSISINYKDRIITIDGNNLTISKMLKDEILISGEIISIRINKRLQT